MSTLSFQDYVRERMLRRRQTETPAGRQVQPARSRPPRRAAPRPPSPPPQPPGRPDARQTARPSAAPAPRVGARSIVDELQPCAT
jgi:flagellar biosynthesis protein FlhF